MKPEELLYADTHEWIAVAEENGAKVATLGISAFAVESLTDLVFIELPKPGRTVTAKEPICEVESVKAVSDIYSPVSGEVVEANSALEDNLEKISEDPYGEGWICKIRIEDEAGLEALKSHADYEKLCAEQA
ncbi:glycine cleavage system protein GcvH [Pseudobythopirellula maris]|nr:glycine cleavage system protein GcvH [Pseudobythopirellula maris]